MKPDSNPANTMNTAPAIRELQIAPRPIIAAEITVAEAINLIDALATLPIWDMPNILTSKGLLEIIPGNGKVFLRVDGYDTAVNRNHWFAAFKRLLIAG